MRKVPVLAVLLWTLVVPADIEGCQGAFTPAFGSSERKAVLDAMREEIRERFDLEVLFVVRWMKVKDGWCWAETNPRSLDGANRYEPFCALLENPGGGWEVREIMPAGGEEPDLPDWLSSLQEFRPGLPAEIFPGSGGTAHSP